MRQETALSKNGFGVEVQRTTRVGETHMSEMNIRVILLLHGLLVKFSVLAHSPRHWKIRLKWSTGDLDESPIRQ